MTHTPQLERITKKAINGAALASTLIGATRAGSGRFHPVFATFEVSAANAIISVTSLSIGTNATTYDDILAITALTGLSSLNKMLKTSILTALSSIAASTDIYVKVTTVAVATECKIDISLWGYYE